MSARRIVARPPRSQRSRPRRRGRLAPTNGSVTRADIEAIHAEFLAGDNAFSPEQRAAISEHLNYLLGAILDPSHGPQIRAKIAAAAARREAARREQRRARKQLAQPPSRALAAA